jgi:hypothetical protein
MRTASEMTKCEDGQRNGPRSNKGLQHDGARRLASLATVPRG